MSNITTNHGPIQNPPCIQLGDMTITILDGGPLWLDGGTMFGIIPKPVWSKLTDVDDLNRIPLSTTCLLVETGGRRILIETGSGAASKFHEKEVGFFRLGDHWILDSLQAIDIERESIDLVILTHLHFDHVGGSTMADGNGKFVPTFPNAKYVVQRGEWEDAVSGYGVMSGTYRPENLQPLEAAAVLSPVDGQAEIAPGISVKQLAGHTRHQQGVILQSGGRQIVQPADLLPTAAHVGARYNMAYDLLPVTNMHNKKRLLADSEVGKWPLLLGQDPHNALWRVIRDEKGRQKLEPAQE